MLVEQLPQATALALQNCDTCEDDTVKYRSICDTGASRFSEAATSLALLWTCIALVAGSFATSKHTLSVSLLASNPAEGAR